MGKRLTPDIVFVIAIIGIIISHILFPLRQIIHYPFWLIGVPIAIAGYVLSRKANLSLARHQTSIQPFKSPKVFVTSGPFGFTRNPVYLGMAIILFGIAWSMGSVTPFVFPVLFVVFLDRLIIPDEERELEKVFSGEYRAYKKKVRRWI